MKSPTDQCAARRRRAADDLREAIVVTRRDLHASIDRLFDAMESLASTVQFEVPTVSDGPRLVGVADTAAHLGVSEATVRAMIEDNQLPCIRLPSSRGSRPMIRFDLDDLDRFLQSCKESA